MSAAAPDHRRVSCRCSTAPCLWSRQEKGFAEAEGVDLSLVRETSWANIRDRLAVGHFDVAHMLAPMPIACNLGLTPLAAPTHRADGARPWRQCRHGVQRSVAGNARSMARAAISIRHRVGAALQADDRRPRQAGQGSAALRRGAPAFRAQLRAALLACGLRHRSRPRHRDRHRAAAADGRCAGGRPHRRLLRRRALEHRGSGQRSRADRHRQGGDLEIQPGKGARRRRAVGGSRIPRRWPRCCGRSTARRRGAQRPAIVAN